MHSSEIQQSIPSAVDFSRVLFQGHDVSCDLKCPDNRSAQGLLPTLSWWSHSKFLLSKSNKQTMGNRGPHSVSPHFLDFLRPAMRTNLILCSSNPWVVLFWTMEGFFYLIGFEKMVHFFSWISRMAPHSQQAWGPELPGGQMWFNLDKCFETNSWLSFRITELTGSCHPHRRMMSGAG